MLKNVYEGLNARKCIWRLKGRHHLKKTGFFRSLSERGGGISPNPKFPNQKMIEIFLDFFAERGGGLTQSKISVIRNCLFFFGNGGGSFPIQNFLIRKNWVFCWIFFAKRGGGLTYSKRVFIIKYWFLSSNTLFFHQILSFFFEFFEILFFWHKKILFYFGVYPKGGGGGLAQSKISVNRKRLKFFWINFVTEGGVRPDPKFLLTEKIRPSKLIGGGGLARLDKLRKKPVFFKWCLPLA